VRGNCYGIGDIDACKACLPHAKDAFYLLPSGDVGKILIGTDRDIVYRCNVAAIEEAVRAPAVAAESWPAALRDRILPAKEYICVLCDLVRPPSYDWNAADWTLISDFDEVPSFDARCAFALSRDGKVASVVSDDHGRYAMNILFNTPEDFLQAEAEWKAALPSEEQRAATAEEVARCFEEDHSCEEDLVAKATDSFAVYTRLMRKLSMYYG